MLIQFDLGHQRSIGTIAYLETEMFRNLFLLFDEVIHKGLTINSNYLPFMT